MVVDLSEWLIGVDLRVVEVGSTPMVSVGATGTLTDQLVKFTVDSVVKYKIDSVTDVLVVKILNRFCN